MSPLQGCGKRRPLRIMIHLDANLLIALVNRADVLHPAAAMVITGAGPFGCPSVAWMEFLSKPATRPRPSDDRPPCQPGS